MTTAYSQSPAPHDQLTQMSRSLASGRARARGGGCGEPRVAGWGKEEAKEATLPQAGTESIDDHRMGLEPRI